MVITDSAFRVLNHLRTATDMLPITDSATIVFHTRIGHPGTVTGGFITASVKGSWISAPSVSIGAG
jgi:hypothetical protein